MDIAFKVIKIMKNLISKLLLSFFFTIVTGCAFTVDTNKVVEIPAPTIGVTDSIADVQIKEPISAVGCARKVFASFNFGEKYFLNTSGYEPSSAVDRAKSAAMYNALRGAEKTALTTDILVNPVYRIVTSDPLIFPFLVHDVCVQVRGHRAVVNGFKQATTISIKHPGESKKQGFWQNFFD